ncbi:MAG: hypothetical protein AUI14_07725 [Actinobacteria bacterium 13_2_20CM_2_71_6]|nr:MAG: hypothetical protein AUI14_07725 [Actinobacteria bacterium 13_2_20CM_2_71_6]
MDTARDEALWRDGEHRIRTELHRIDDVLADLRAGTRNLHWQGPGAGRFRWRTERRLRELSDQRALLETLLSLTRRAGETAGDSTGGTSA